MPKSTRFPGTPPPHTIAFLIPRGPLLHYPSLYHSILIPVPTLYPQRHLAPLTVHSKLQGDLSLQVWQVYSGQIGAFLKGSHGRQPEGPVPSPWAPWIIIIPSSKCHCSLSGCWHLPTQPRSCSQEQMPLTQVLSSPLQPKGRGT